MNAVRTNQSEFASVPELVQVNNLTIRYPRYSALMNLIELCRQLSKISDEPQCLALEGETGAGKSNLATNYSDIFPRVITRTHTYVPVLYLLTPKPATIPALLEKLLAALGDPEPERGKTPAKQRRLVKLLIACRVELVILDEFQHMVDSETDYVLQTVTDTLKYLIKETNIPFVVLGITGKVFRVVDSNKQLARLFGYRESLDSFEWDSIDPNSVEELNRFVTMIENATINRFVPDMARIEFLSRLHYATDGKVGHIMYLIRDAFLYSYMNNGISGKIGIDIFQKAFAMRIQRLSPTKTNPFYNPDIPFVVPQPKIPADPPESVSNRGKRGKAKEKPASEVLKT